MSRAPLLICTALLLSLVGCGKKAENQAEPAAVNDSAMANAAENAAAPAGNASASASVDVSNWAALDEAVGKYPADLKLYEQSAITAPLKTLLGDDFDDFVENMQVSGPLSKDGVLYVTGNKPHEGGSDAAYLLIDPQGQKLEVGLWDDGKFKSYTSAGALLTRPKDVRMLISNMRSAPETG